MFSGTVGTGGIQITKKEDTRIYFLDPKEYKNDNTTIEVTLWKENIHYSIGDIIKHENDFYKCTKDHTSINTLDLQCWNRLEYNPIVVDNILVTSFSDEFDWYIENEATRHHMRASMDKGFNVQRVYYIRIKQKGIKYEIEGQFS